MREFVTQSPTQTLEVGETWAGCLKPGDVLGFVGPLGSGKTTLIQGIMKGLGVDDRVQSPSFILARTYQACFTVKHVDLYRLDPGEVEDLYLEEIFDEEGIMLVEWAERASYLPGIVSNIKIDFIEDWYDGRRIVLTGSVSERLV
ncbi:tRNA (adenosine(37)-N6)-threonylcarbamoyltransferase complex ATPase subunit type 1 TsaE [candidate division WOR-3 bacterium]|nr:tRNA (adenosine(37)-N6)-threonylcarbamoyltransferase complex ATPase subunit type 1 TsaE [candidate division WOR-3 bacterium]